MTDMMHSTTAIIVMAVFVLVVISGLFLVVRVAGERERVAPAKQPTDARQPRTPPAH